MANLTVEQAKEFLREQGHFFHLWHTLDIIVQAQENGKIISEEKAEEIARKIERGHDCELGITYDVIDNYID